MSAEPTATESVQVRHRKGHENGWTRIRNAILHTPYSLPAKMLLWVLLSYGYGKKTFYQSMKQTCHLTSASPYLIRAARKELKAAGEIDYTETRGRGNATVYVLTGALKYFESTKTRTAGKGQPGSPFLSRKGLPSGPFTARKGQNPAPQEVEVETRSKSSPKQEPAPPAFSATSSSTSSSKAGSPTPSSPPPGGPPDGDDAYASMSDAERLRTLPDRLRKRLGIPVVRSSGAGSDDLPSVSLMWLDVSRPGNRSRLNSRERIWVEGQMEYRTNGRTEWSKGERTMLVNIYTQRIAKKEVA